MELMEHPERRTGTVVHVVKERGYFFIFYEGRRIFCHTSQWSELEMPLINDQVSFEIGPARKDKYQFEAVNVKPCQPVTNAVGVSALATKEGAQ